MPRITKKFIFSEIIAHIKLVSRPKAKLIIKSLKTNLFFKGNLR